MRMVFRDRIVILPAVLSYVMIGGAMLCLAQESALKPSGDTLSNPDTNPAKIIVVDDCAYAPFAFLDPEGVPRGVTIDIWNLWSRKTGIPVEFRLMEWEAALAAVRDGEADVVGGLFRTPPREEIFDFTQAFYKISTGVFFPRNIMGIRGLDELNGFLVGVVKGDSAEDTLRMKNPAIRLELFPDTESMVKAALAGKIKVFVADTFVVRFYLAKHDAGEKFLEAFNLVTDNEQYAAVRKGNRPLLDILQEGFDRISQREIQKIVDSWTGVSLFSRIPWTSLWSFVLLAAALLAVMILWNLQLKRKVVRATLELWQRNEDLQRSERNYREIFNSTSDMIFIHDAKDGRILDVNQAVEERFGVAKEELQGKTVQSLSVDLPSFSEEEALWKIKQAKNAGDLVFEWLCQRANGKTFWTEVSLRGTHIGGENRVLAICRDITERKRTEEELLQRERILKAQNDILLELMANGKMFLGDFQNAIQEITEACGLLLSVERVSVWLYSDNYETIHCVDLYELSKKSHSRGEKLRSADFPAYTRCHRQGRVIVATDVFTDPRTREIPESYYREHDIRSLMDAPIWMGQRIHGLLSFEATGRVREWTQEEERLAHIMAAMVSLGFEIAERKRAEEEREKLQAQLVQAQKMESVGRLAGGVAHDFNNMLGVILGHAELALGRLDADSPFYTDLKEIEKAAKRSSDLTRQLLAFARKQTVTPKVLDLNEAIEGMLKMLRRLIGEDIHLAWIPGKNLGAVRIDPSQIDQIMANLCVNARDAIQGNGQITIETKNVEFDDLYCTRNAGFLPGEFIMLAIDDNGCGMDKETQGKIFEPFFTTKEVGQGTGLGLATVFGIVQQNDGFINVYSEPGKGSSFKIYLPRIRESTREIQDSSGTKSPPGGGETVLLVEDEPMILNMGQTMLEMLGYRVMAAGTPGEAIRLAEKHAGEIHLLMTDVIMPEMNGRDLAQRLLSLYPNLKQLFMSGYTADVIAHQGVLNEGVTFLQKPFQMKILSAKVREALERP